MVNEVIVYGIPVSLQTKNPKRRLEWIDKVKDAGRAAIPEGERHEFVNVSVTIIYFCFDWDEGDLDNIAKPILDGLNGPAYHDDSCITQLTLRRTNLGAQAVEFIDTPVKLLDAIQSAYTKREDFIYVRIANEIDHRRFPWNP
jgi:Holliday junction resolvase RusA-like endonuclease